MTRLFAFAGGTVADMSFQEEQYAVMQAEATQIIVFEVIG